MNLFIRLVLSLVFFLISGYTSVEANAHQDHACYAPIQILENPRHANVSISQDNRQIPTTCSTAGKEKVRDRIIEQEDEDDDKEELTLIKKQVALTNYFVTFYPKSPGHPSRTIKSWPFCRHLSYFSDSRSIVFRSIRI